MKYRTYKVNVSHDKGTTNFTLRAPSQLSAIRSVLSAEGCPLSAINSIKRLKTRKVEKHEEV